MRLHQLLEDVDVLGVRGDPADVDVADVAHDAATVTSGALFCCVRGTRADGHDFAAEAVRRGAVALLAERPLPLDVPQALVADTRPAMARAAAAFHGHPSRQLAVVGVTGTNGKTTTTHLLASVMAAAGRPARVVGTLSGTRTTPESTELQALLARHLAEGASVVAMEVSSHALVQHRVDAVRFEVAVFTNLSRDHLEYHGTMEHYFRAKASLFEPGRAAVAVVGVDDRYGRRLAAEARLPVRPFSLSDARDLEVGRSGSNFTWEGQPVHLPLGGRFNVANALAAAVTARELGVPAAAVAEGLASAEPVRGRFELVETGRPFLVVVDYAHTPDGLAHALGAGRELTGAGGEVIVVFGCGGERDPGKRAPMGEVATRLADLAVLTSDNPRGEDPAAILAQVRAGARPGAPLVVEPDRRRAIELALGQAGDGDVVVVAGKGHETGQVVGDRVLPFDDREVVRSILAAAAAPEAGPR